MSAHFAYRRRGLVAAALARAEAWLLEPVEPLDPAAAPERPGPAPAPRVVEVRVRPVVTIVGLAARSGATTVARALGAELAARDPAGASVVSCASLAGGIPLGGAAAGRLVRSLSAIAEGRARPVGRLCLVESSDHLALADATRYLAPLVLDVGHGLPPGPAISVADHVVLVTSPEIEPALAPVVSASLARVGPEPITVVNRASEGRRWDGRADALLPDSRMGAQLALGGREARGDLGRAVAELAFRCGEARRA